MKNTPIKCGLVKKLRFSWIKKIHFKGAELLSVV